MGLLRQMTYRARKTCAKCGQRWPNPWARFRSAGKEFSIKLPRITPLPRKSDCPLRDLECGWGAFGNENLLATIMHTLLDIGQVRLMAGLPQDLLRAITIPSPIRRLI